MTNEDLVGVWREESRDIIRADGNVTPDVPRTSQIMYSPDGFVSVVSTPSKRDPIPETVPRMDLKSTTADARAEASEGVTSYAGAYQVEGDDVHHIIFTALNPNRVGDTQIRHVALTDDDLILTAPQDANGNYFRIHWRRVKQP